MTGEHAGLTCGHCKDMSHQVCSTRVLMRLRSALPFGHLAVVWAPGHGCDLRRFALLPLPLARCCHGAHSAGGTHRRQWQRRRRHQGRQASKVPPRTPTALALYLGPDLVQ